MERGRVYCNTLEKPGRKGRDWVALVSLSTLLTIAGCSEVKSAADQAGNSNDAKCVTTLKMEIPRGEAVGDDRCIYAAAGSDGLVRSVIDWRDTTVCTIYDPTTEADPTFEIGEKCVEEMLPGLNITLSRENSNDRSSEKDEKTLESNPIHPTMVAGRDTINRQATSTPIIEYPQPDASTANSNRSCVMKNTINHKDAVNVSNDAAGSTLFYDVDLCEIDRLLVGNGVTGITMSLNEVYINNPIKNTNSGLMIPIEPGIMGNIETEYIVILYCHEGNMTINLCNGVLTHEIGHVVNANIDPTSMIGVDGSWEDVPWEKRPWEIRAEAFRVENQDKYQLLR